MIEGDEKPLRILISGHEICGLIHDLAYELESRGHQVTTIAMAHRFFPYRYDYDQYRLAQSILSSRFRGSAFWSLALSQLWKVAPGQHKALEKRLRINLALSNDIYLRVWGMIPFDEEVLQAIHGTNVRVGTFFMGSDVRDHSVFVQQYGSAGIELPSEYQVPSLSSKLRALRVHERYADAIFSVPDQMGLALRPYHHLQVPLRLPDFNFNVPGRRIPRVVHAPSAPHVKGTDIIENALRVLRKEGLEFEFISIREMCHADVVRLLSEADVLVDELIFHGPGWLSFEAMASGCAVATRYLADSAASFRPPVWPVDSENLIPRLRELLSNQELRVRLGAEGRRYVEANNNVSSVTDSILTKVQRGADAKLDYFPDFLLKSYRPQTSEELQSINTMNALVDGESWYKDRIAGANHDGLVF